MKINIKPAGFLVTGSTMFKDRIAIGESYANGIISERGADNSRIEPLYPESLVMELAEALQAMLDSAETEIDVNVDAYFKGRGLLDRVKNGSTS